MTVARHLVAQRGLVDALIEPHAAAIVIIVVAVVGGFGDGVHALDVDGDIFAEIGQRGHGFDRAVVGDDHAVGLQPRTGTWRCRRHQDAKLLAFLQAAIAAAGAERRRDRLGLVRRRALIAQDRGDAIALLDDMNALAGWIAAGDLFLGLRQQRDVFRHHAGLKAGIGIGDGAFGGVGQLEVGLRAAGVGRGSWRGRCSARRRCCRASSRRRAPASDTSSSATTAASFAFGSTGARSLVTKETSASGSARRHRSDRRRRPGSRRRHRSACAGH